MILFTFKKPDGVIASVIANKIEDAISALQHSGWHFEAADCTGETEKLAHLVSVEGPPMRQIRPEMLSTP